MAEVWFTKEAPPEDGTPIMARIGTCCEDWEDVIYFDIDSEVWRSDDDNVESPEPYEWRYLNG